MQGNNHRVLRTMPLNMPVSTRRAVSRSAYISYIMQSIDMYPSAGMHVCLRIMTGRSDVARVYVDALAYKFFYACVTTINIHRLR